MGGSGYFEKIFPFATGFYTAAFAAAVYATTDSATTKMGAVLLISALPALLASEICGGDTARTDALVDSWRKEFIGTAVMIYATCCPGAMVGHYGYKPEWLLHVFMVFLADYSCGGPQVNPAVTTSLYACGGFGLTAEIVLANIMAQVGGGVVGWRLLLASTGAASVVLVLVTVSEQASGDSFLPGKPGGPSPHELLPWYYLALCEFLACWTLLGSVYCFATSKPFAKAGELAKVYTAKMSLIAITIRMLIIAHGATGPALNPALATSYAIAANGSLPGLDSTHYQTYWLGGIAGAAAMGFVWKVLGKLSPDSAPVFPSEIFKIVVGIYFAGLATVLWYYYFQPYTASIIADALEAAKANSVDKRNVVQKAVHSILRRAAKI